MPVEVRELVIKTDVASVATSGEKLTQEQLAQLREELINEVDKRINRHTKRDSFNR